MISLCHSYNHGQVLDVNATNYLCFTTEIRDALPHPIHLNSGEIAGTSFQHRMWGGGHVRQGRLYSPLACVQKRSKYQFITRLLSMIVAVYDFISTNCYFTTYGGFQGELEWTASFRIC